ncbi:MAG: lactonase family protein [Erysipelothrix sp.]|nr:lactonase family protein [Erysipelothrix sp.]
MTYKMYIGGYSSDNSSIYEVNFYPENNELKIESVNNESLNPVHIRIKDDILFTANEIDEVARVSSFRINADGSLKLINRMDAQGFGTCDITVDDDILYGANYGSGNIFSVVFEEDGQLIEVMSNINHIGEEPRAHSTILSKDSKYLYEANLGLDRIFAYEVFPEGIIRSLPSQLSVSLKDNEGPRHMNISRDGKYLYVVNEFGNSIYSYSINPVNGHLQQIDRIKLTDDIKCYAADIHFAKHSDQLYVSLRGNNEIYLIDVEDGKMTIVEKYPSGGKWPRSFTITDDSKYMIVTNQYSDTVSVLEINQNTGALSAPVAEVEIFRPTTVAIYK